MGYYSDYEKWTWNETDIEKCTYLLKCGPWTYFPDDWGDIKYIPIVSFFRSDMVVDIKWQNIEGSTRTQSINMGDTDVSGLKNLLETGLKWMDSQQEADYWNGKHPKGIY